MISMFMKRKIKKYSFILLAALFVALTACSTHSADDSSKNQKDETNKSGLLTLENDGVDEEKFKEALEQFPEHVPERIIATSVPLTEMLHLLDITPVGVPTSTNPIPEDFKLIDQIGSPMAPDLEVMTNLEPDLILGAKSLRSTLEKNLEGMNMTTAYLPTDSFDDLKLSFKVLGTYFNKTEEMNKKMQLILDKENELKKRAEGKELPTVMLMIGTSDSFMVMNEKSYLGSLVERLGADNIATSVLKAKDTYSPMNMEEIAVANPDVILVLASGDHGASKEMFQKEMEKNDIWKKLSAYKNDKIHILDNEVFGVTSISNVEKALTEIADYFLE